MTNEPKPISTRKQLSVILNPLKSGKRSKNANPQLAELIKNPKFFFEKISNAIQQIENECIDVKERILYAHLLLKAFDTFKPYFNEEEKKEGYSFKIIYPEGWKEPENPDQKPTEAPQSQEKTEAEIIPQIKEEPEEEEPEEENAVFL